MWFGFFAAIGILVVLAVVIDRGKPKRAKEAKQKLDLARMKLEVSPENGDLREDCQRALAEYENALAVGNPGHRKKSMRQNQDPDAGLVSRDDLPLRWFRGEERKLEKARRQAAKRKTLETGMQRGTADKCDDLGRFDNRGNRRIRRVAWLACTILATAILAIVVSRIGRERVESIADVFPIKTGCFKTIGEGEVLLLSDSNLWSRSLEAASVAYIPQSQWKAEGLLDLGIRIDRFASEEAARHGEGPPRLDSSNQQIDYEVEWTSATWDILDFPTDGESAAFSTLDLINSAGSVICEGVVYTSACSNYRIQVSAIMRPNLLYSSSGLRKCVFDVWEVTHKRVQKLLDEGWL